MTLRLSRWLTVPDKGERLSLRPWLYCQDGRAWNGRLRRWVQKIRVKDDIAT